jgi:hypothetical protein
MEALAELNRIVARHGRTMDTVGAETARRQQREVPVSVAATSRGETARRYEAAPPAGAAQRGRVEAPPVAPNGSNGQGRGGWISDLLTRASNDGAPPPAQGGGGGREAYPPQRPEAAPRGEDRNVRHTIESLDSLSVDIARMIDHDAAAELWERYNRGERNVFTRRLYTMQGQKAFDEVRRRYKGDREFRQTVDRYIGEFERLLNEVARDDRGQVVARTYLTSETGKVYTMLAHAAGRFE